MVVKKGIKPKTGQGSKPKILLENANMTLSMDHFGVIYDESGRRHYVKRFTWKNHNDIQVQVVSYGARITSMCLPDRKGVVQDIVLAYDDIAGCLYYEEIPFGATIGRCTDRIENATFAIDGKQYYLNKNDNSHHKDGGCKGFDKALWKSYADGSKVILTHVSQDKDQGYPGDLFVRITYELTPKNEFHVRMEAQTSAPTIVNLSQLLYVNLAGHHTGPCELYKHIVAINANCFTATKGDNLPNGKIMNVNYSKNDFMTPTLLKDVIGIEDEDGYDQNFCINKGVDQGLCYASRILHPPSGRILEIYTDQYGVNFSTANDWGHAVIDLLKPFEDSAVNVVDSDLDQFDLVNKLHEKMRQKFEMGDDYSELKRLIRNLYKQSINYHDLSLDKKREFQIVLDSQHEDGLEEEAKSEVRAEEEEEEYKTFLQRCQNVKLTKSQREYLQLMQSLSSHSVTRYDEVKEVITKILDLAELMHSTSSVLKTVTGDGEGEGEGEGEGKDENEGEEEGSVKSESRKFKRKAPVKKGGMAAMNEIPKHYKDGRIHGKGNCIYKRHCALALQTQNYPNAIYHKNFPNCVLRPGETYQHTTVYKFWIQDGDASNWIRTYKKRIKKEGNKDDCPL